MGSQLNDGLSHHVSLIVTTTGASILVNSNNCSSDVVCFGQTKTTTNISPVFTSPCYIGGVVGYFSNATQFHLETDQSLVSTLSSLRIDHELVDYNDIIELSQIMLGSVHIAPLCQPNPCANSQPCYDLWSNYTCDCNNGYTGDHCQLLTTAHFDTTSALMFTLPMTSKLQFEFTVQSDGFLFSITIVRNA